MWWTSFWLELEKFLDKIPFKLSWIDVEELVEHSHWGYRGRTCCHNYIPVYLEKL